MNKTKTKSIVTIVLTILMALTCLMALTACGNDEGKIKTTEVSSLQELKTAVESDCDVVKLTADIDSDETIYITRKISFNLNEKTLKGSGYDGVFCVSGNGDLTITGNGNIVAKEDKTYAMAIWAKGNAKVTIKNGNFLQNITGSDTQYDMIYVSESAQITILGGHFESVTPAWTLNKLDKDRSTAELIVKGGTYVEFNPADCLTEGPNTNFVAEGYKSEKIEGTNNYRVVKIAE